MNYSSLLSQKSVLASRWLAMDYSGFQGHVIILFGWSTVVSFRSSTALTQFQSTDYRQQDFEPY
jgi:hypothetical protein